MNETPKYRHVPYYREKHLDVNTEYTEMIKDDAYQGLGVPGRSGFIEVLDSGGAAAYAAITIFDGIHKSNDIPLHKGGSINYSYWDAIYAEWVRLKAVNGWIEYRIHYVPGVWEEIE